MNRQAIISVSKRALSVCIASMLLAGCGRGAVTSTLVTSQAALAQANALKPSVTTRPGEPEAPAAHPEAVAGEMIVRFKGEQRELPGATLKGKAGAGNTFLYKMKNASYTVQAIEEWEDAEDIDYIEPNYLYTAVGATPNDPSFLTGSWGVSAVNAPAVWGVTQGQGVKVAVIDTGVSNHPDLAGNLLPGRDFVNDDNDASDDHGHGTHVAGSVAAVAGNGIAVAGVAPQAKIIPIKVLNAQGVGNNADIAAGIIEAADRGAQIINMSLGGPDNSETLRRAIATVQARGVVVVCAAGNEKTNTAFYPAACEGVIGVGAVDKTRTRSYFSNYGDYVDIAAPGSDIGSLAFQGGMKSMSGTSMASPHVSGVAALLLSAFPNLKATHILRVMQNSGYASSSFSQTTPPRVVNAEGALVQVATLDMQAPSKVFGLAAVAGAPGEVKLTWFPATDNKIVAGYTVLRDGQPIGTASTTAFTDNGLGANSTGRYTVVAFDADGNEGGASDVVSAQGGQASVLIQDLQVTERGKTHLVISWRTAQPMRCYIQWGTTSNLGSGTGWETVPTTEHQMKLENLTKFKQYHYRVVAADAASRMNYTNTLKVRTKIWWIFGF